MDLSGVLDSASLIALIGPNGASKTMLLGMAGVAPVTLPVLALIWRPFVLESFDPGFMAATSGKGDRGT